MDKWVAHIGRTLYEGVAYRHVVLTMPDALHLEFYRDRPLLADLMQCGVAMLRDALSWFKQRSSRLNQPQPGSPSRAGCPSPASRWQAAGPAGGRLMASAAQGGAFPTGLWQNSV